MAARRLVSNPKTVELLALTGGRLIFRSSLVLVTSMGISYDQHKKSAINDNEGEVELGKPHD
jgi:hypothetical protein